jgi:hypothetical protein
MFNTVYRCTRTIARHENGPLAEPSYHSARKNTAEFASAFS